MPDRRAPQVALELGDQLEVALGLLVRRIRGEEVSRIGKAVGADRPQVRQPQQARSEEHTSELQSLMRISYAVFCLKKKTNNNKIQNEYVNTQHLRVQKN